MTRIHGEAAEELPLVEVGLEVPAEDGTHDIITPVSPMRRRKGTLGGSDKGLKARQNRRPGGSWKAGFAAVVFGSRMNVLLVFAPLSFLARLNGWSDSVLFLFALLAICPFAERLGYITEQLAMETNATIGGLLNATFGNVTELIISVFALLKGRTDPEMLRVVQVSLLGSILSNLLLVLGTAFLVGGVRHSEQKFNRVGAKTNTGLLMLIVMALVFPAVLDATHEGRDESAALTFSRFTSVILLLAYVLFLGFQLRTHRHLFDDEDDEEDDEERVLGFSGSIVWLTICTVFISFLSEYLVDAIQGASRQYNVPTLFTGTIVIPIVGNAAEHASAVMFAWRNKMDIALGVAIGSSVQIALSVIPACVVIGWIIGAPLTLDFHPFETATVFTTVIAVAFLAQDGTSHWLQGVMLVFMYVIIAAGFFEHTDRASSAAP